MLLALQPLVCFEGVTNGEWILIVDYLRRRSSETVSLWRPLARRDAKTLRPLADCIRLRKPWTVLRRLRCGWYVRFITYALAPFTTGIVFLKELSVSDQYVVVIRDELGRSLKTMRFSGLNTFSFSLIGLPYGLYLLELHNKTTSFILPKKIVFTKNWRWMVCT